MKFICEKSSLQQAAAICSRAAAVKSPIPALEGILIHAGEVLRLTGYDLKKGIYTDVEADIEEYGSIVVGARFFGEMLRRMPDGKVCVSTDAEMNVYVSCGKNEYKFMGTATEDFPEIPAIGEVNILSIPMASLKSMINQTLFSVSDNDIRPIYTGALFEVEEEKINIVAVDGYRLAKRTETFKDRKMNVCSFVVPGNTLSDIERICTDDKEKEVTVSVGEKHIAFGIENTVVISRLLEGEFMNYRKSLPDKFVSKIVVERAELINSIDRISIIITDKAISPVRMTFREGSIYLNCINPVGKAEDVCPCEGNGNEMEIGFNCKYMSDALKAAAEEKVMLCINSPSAPCILKSEQEDESFTYMILPVRLKA